MTAPTWATVTTLKEPLDRVLDFTSQHVYLGAAEIWLYFDDPDDRAIMRVADHPSVRAVRCDRAYWSARGGRPDRIEGRQKANANDAYRRSRADWIIHLDADELVHSDRPVADLLATAAAGSDSVRLVPFEALFYAKAAQDGRPDHYFRGPVPGKREKAQRIAESAYGQFAGYMRQGMLSHTDGKYFARTGQDDMALAIHQPFRGEGRATSEVIEGLRLLHLHGSDYEEWRSRFSFRLEEGAYAAHHDRWVSRVLGEERTLNGCLRALMETEGEAGLRRFFDTVCTYDRSKRILRNAGAMLQRNLWLAPKRAAFLGEPHRLSHLTQDAVTGQFEGDLDWDGIALRIAPDDGYVECLLARGEPAEAEEIAALADAVAGQRVLFHDIGAGVGLYTLKAAMLAAPESRIVAFEADPARLGRLRRNLALNRTGDEVTVRPVLLGAAAGSAVLAHGAADPEATESEIGAGVTVPVAALSAEVASAGPDELAVMRIAERAADILPVLLTADLELPELLFLPTGTEEGLLAALALQGYATVLTTRATLFLRRPRRARARRPTSKASTKVRS